MKIDQLLNELYLLNTDLAGQVHDVLVSALGSDNLTVPVVSEHIIWYTRLLYEALPETSEKRGEVGAILQLLEETDWV